MATVRLVLFGMLAAAIPLLLDTFVDSFELGPGVSAAFAVLGGGLTAVVDRWKEPRPQRPADPYRRVPVRQPRGGAPVVVAIVVVLLLGAAAYGGAKLWQYLAGTEPGVERMAPPPATGTAGPLTARVDGVEVSPHFIKVRLTATNSAADTITMPVNDQWCHLIGADGTSLPAYGGITGLGRGNIEVPGGEVPVTEVITFKGQPVDPLVLNFSVLFGTFEARSLQIPEIRLRE